MKSKSTFDAATFELPEPTAADLIALERADRHALSPEEYLQFLLIMTKDLPSSRELDGSSLEPFEL